MIADAESILKVTGLGKYLHIGCTKNQLVFELLKRSVDAYGLSTDENVLLQYQRRAPQRFVKGDLIQYPFTENAFDTIIISDEALNFPDELMVQAMKVLREATKCNLVLYFPFHLGTSTRRRRFWEQAALAAGFRRHPRNNLINLYHEGNETHLPRLLFFQKITNDALIENVAADRLRESSVEADTAIAQYTHVISHIRHKDIVLTLGCGSGFGVAILAEMSHGGQFIGVDSNEAAIQYAKQVYSHYTNVAFQQIQDQEKLPFADHSIDTVIAFDFFESQSQPDILLQEIKRVLKPDGRLFGSFKNAIAKVNANVFIPIIQQYFIIDAMWAQPNERPAIHLLNLKNANYANAVWWLFSACVNPQAATLPYINPFNQYAEKTKLIAFEEYYDNPWLYRVMVQLGERIIDKDVLYQFCHHIISTSRLGSADMGAALCVMAYQLLEAGNTEDEVIRALLEAIQAYEKAYDQENPHAYRWAMSLYYVSARLLLTIGDREAALQHFLICASMEPLKLTPLLATKTISSRMYAGLIYVSDQDKDKAREQFLLGVKEAHRVLQEDWKTIIGHLDNPLPFGLPEAAEVLDIASQCVHALHALDRHANAPGYFWDKINLRRFGLVEWNKSLERENADLRRQLAGR